MPDTSLLLIESDPGQSMAPGELVYTDVPCQQKSKDWKTKRRRNIGSARCHPLPLTLDEKLGQALGDRF